MTEEEAKTKWCPMVRVNSYPNPMNPTRTLATFNRDIDTVVETNSPGWTCNCIASACMAWRWNGPAVHSPGCASVVTQMDKDPLPCDCNSVRHGYCGLAGDR